MINTPWFQDTTENSHLRTCKEPLCTEIRICVRLPSPLFDRGNGRHAVPWGVLSSKNTIRGFVFSVCRNDCLQIIYRPKMNPSAASTNNAGSRSVPSWSPPALLLQHFFITTFPSQPPGCLGYVPPCATILHCRLLHRVQQVQIPALCVLCNHRGAHSAARREATWCLQPC